MPDSPGGEPRYPVRAVIARTGLTADVLRAWERRYKAVSPQRSAGGQRLYSEDDVARLSLLRRATRSGHSIAEIARLSSTALEALLVPQAAVVQPAASAAIDALLDDLLRATEHLDASALESTLKRAALVHGSTTFVETIASRFLGAVGDRWHDGAISPAHEHLASNVVRRVLDWVTQGHGGSLERAPRLVVATPAGEQHELGAMLAAAAASEEGWRVVYLGASLPAADIVAAARQSRARAVALSIVYENDTDGVVEVERIARELPAGVPLFVGGRAAERRADALRDAGARLLTDIPSLRQTLRALRGATRGEPHGSP